jgi:hypothetical protein
VTDPRELAGARLRWVRTRYLPAGFSLRWHDTEVGSLRWESLFSSRALARSGERSWRLQRHGLRGVAIEDGSGDSPVATLAVHGLGSAELSFRDGRTVTFRRSGLLPPSWTFFDSLGSPLLRVRGYLAMLFRGGHCDVEPAAAAYPEAGLIALLGVYVLVRRARRRARE